ncbi:flavin-containing monooxygenase [Mycobacterium sp. smrl_JER01]|uniref:flavin-containing monooxygenase n=1 Tax=Mycobacterium sp. smrl_JER01 TaxID=3402633 RepID=UPI003AD5187C
MNKPQSSPRIGIIGAGMSGLCMGARLLMAGIESFTIYEKASELGGTWRDNTYPGLTCDIPSRFYQFKFAPNPDWTQRYSKGEEIWRYFDSVADQLRLRDYVRTGCEVTDARFVDGHWQVSFADGSTDEVDFLISACGVLRIPNVPDIPGADSFGGELLHSVHFDRDMPVRGRRVAVIGTGSTGVQLVGALGGVASHVTLFQRTPQWIMPMSNPSYRPITRAMYRRFPMLNRLAYDGNRVLAEWGSIGMVKPGLRRKIWQAMCRRHLNTVKDPALRQALTPDYQAMCKRLVFSGRFYKAIQRPDVSLATEKIEAIEKSGVRTADGVLHEVDIIVLATGFDAHAYQRPMNLVGRDGITLDDAWRGGPRAYMTVSLPGFPNHFMLMGPHSPFGTYSLTQIADTQAQYIVGWLKRWQRGEFVTVEPTQEATDRFNAEMRAAMPGTVWASGCQSWYLGPDGLPALFPWPPQKHRKMLAEPRLADHRLDRQLVAL